MKEQFGVFKNQPFSLYTLENDHLIMKVTNYGATLVSLIHKSSHTDVVAGFEHGEQYVGHTAHFGACVGRCANRIKDAQFTLNGTVYHLDQNDGKNSIHGGYIGFDHRVYDVEEKKDAIIFKTVSPDGEDGYPGNLTYSITYQLLEDGVRIILKGSSDQDTLLGFTNHTYFNLNGNGNVLDHLLTIHSHEYALNDEHGLALNKVEDVKNTPFDFTEEKAIGKDIHDDNEQLKMARGGYDHHYLIPGEGVREMSVCRANNLKVIMRSNLAGMHLYTANYLDGSYTGKYGVTYDYQDCVCFEAEYYPNAINYDGHKKPILRRGEVSEQIIEYLLTEDK